MIQGKEKMFVTSNISVILDFLWKDLKINQNGWSPYHTISSCTTLIE